LPSRGSATTMSFIQSNAEKLYYANSLGEKDAPQMKDSSKARYAVAALVDLACQPPHHPTTLAAIAKRQDISVSYLEQLFARLRAGGLIKSVRGPGGGYVLARASHEITIADIYGAVFEPDTAAVPAPPAEDVSLKVQMENLWLAMEREVAKFLQSVTVQDVLSGKLANQSGERLPAE
jgi:Rrf2 family transcriptional regulator, iron-sulfur cluster assembly transcription factor